MVKIRLKRMGATKRPFYRLVVADSRSPRDGRFIELLGWYDPLTEPARVHVDADKVHEWMRKGARPSDAARDLLVREGILAKTPRTYKPAPEREAAPVPTAAASETPGAPEEVDASESLTPAGDEPAPGADSAEEVAAETGDPEAEIGPTTDGAVDAEPESAAAPEAAAAEPEPEAQTEP